MIDPVNIAAIVLYALLGVANVASFIYYSTKSKEYYAYDYMQRAFHLILGLFVIVRITWFALRLHGGRSSAEFITNRVGFALFFTSFTIVLFYWAETYHKNYVIAQGFLPRLFKTFVVVNLALYIALITVVAVFLIADGGDSSNREGNAAYEASIFLQVGVSFLVSVGFLIYGIRLFMAHGRAHDFEENYWTKAREIMRILVSTIICSVCSFVRVVAFLYRPITDEYMNNDLFQTLAYFIPELLPSVVQFYLIRSKGRREKEDTQYIQSLYQQEEDARDEVQHVQQSYSPTSAVIYE